MEMEKMLKNLSKEAGLLALGALGLVGFGIFYVGRSTSEEEKTVPVSDVSEGGAGQVEVLKEVEKEMIQGASESTLPETQIDVAKSYTAVLTTTQGAISIKLHADTTPITVNNFVSLAKKGFYDGTVFHRVLKGFMIQGGDPKGNGTGGPGYKFDDEPFEGEYTRGIVAMANSGPNTNGSQFFIMHKDYPLPKNYVIFGEVVEGIEVVDKIAEAEVAPSASGESSTPVSPVVVESVKILEE